MSAQVCRVAVTSGEEIDWVELVHRCSCTPRRRATPSLAPGGGGCCRHRLQSPWARAVGVEVSPPVQLQANPITCCSSDKCRSKVHPREVVEDAPAPHAVTLPCNDKGRENTTGSIWNAAHAPVVLLCCVLTLVCVSAHWECLWIFEPLT